MTYEKSRHPKLLYRKCAENEEFDLVNSLHCFTPIADLHVFGENQSKSRVFVEDRRVPTPCPQNAPFLFFE